MKVNLELNTVENPKTIIWNALFENFGLIPFRVGKIEPLENNTFRVFIDLLFTYKFEVSDFHGVPSLATQFVIEEKSLAYAIIKYENNQYKIVSFPMKKLKQILQTIELFIITIQTNKAYECSFKKIAYEWGKFRRVYIGEDKN